MRWFEIKIYTDSMSVEAVTNMLYEVGAEGIVIEDPNDVIFSESYKGNWDYVDEKIYDFDDNEACVKGYCSDIEPESIKVTLQEKVDALEGFGLAKGSGKIEITEVVDEDWAHEWKKYFKPLKIGQHIVIKPTWEAYEASDDEMIIEMDPGSAFGSGTHETTSMCVAFIDEYIKSGDRAFDIGCGTGILGIAAAKLGAGEVVCGDIDELAVIATKENIELNKVGDQVRVSQGDLTEVFDGKADMVIANIIADVIIMLAKDVPTYLNKEGIFIASGIIHDKRDLVRSAIEAAGFKILEVRTQGEWNAIVARLDD
jgi:ribosomal protein L11 methyltransferase